MVHTAAVEKVNLVKEDPDYYSTSREPLLLTVAGHPFISITGQGSPESTGFQDAFRLMYGVAYTLKFAGKKLGRPDFAVAPMEGLWWVGDESESLNSFGDQPRESWRWRLLIRIPEFITEADYRGAVEEITRKKDDDGYRTVHFLRLAEGLCVQVLHVGPYATEHTTIARMSQYIGEHGLEHAGAHHEIYLSDPRRTAPERIRTILRQPVRRR